jgi:hypothetical protein
MSNRQRTEKPSKKLKFRLVEQTEEKEALDDLEVAGNLARRREPQAVEIEIDLSDDEVGQGIQVTEVERARGIVREVATFFVAILLIILIFSTTEVPQAIMLSILGSIVIYFFGKHVGRRH